MTEQFPMPAGWYPDPAKPGSRREWDGQAWVGPSVRTGGKKVPWWGIPAGACLILGVLFVVIGALAPDRDEGEAIRTDESTTASPSTSDRETATTTPATTTTTTTTEVTTTAVPPTTTTTVPATTAPPTTAAPATTVPPPPPAIMPAVTCLNLQVAQDTIQAAGVFFSRSEDATGQGRSQILDANWVVVAQTPAPGTPVGELEAVLSAVKIGEPSPC